MSENDLTQSGINYDLLVEDSLRNVTRAALAIAEHAGLPGEAHFYITFKTDYDGVKVNPDLAKGDETELTIVLQHQYWDLSVQERFFTVTLSFSGVPETLVIPYAAITQFTDPSAGFSLQFDVDNVPLDEQEIDEAATSSNEKDSEASAEIVSLDSFRNKPDRSS